MALTNCKVLDSSLIYSYSTNVNIHSWLLVTLTDINWTQNILLPYNDI